MVVLCGDVDGGGNPATITEIHGSINAHIAILFPVIQVFEDVLGDAVGHAPTANPGGGNQGDYSSRGPGRAPVIVGALPEASLPTLDVGRNTLLERKVGFID